jgi:hypothetical protein
MRTRVLIPKSKSIETPSFDCDDFISEIKKLVESKHKMTEEVVEILAGYKYTYKIGDITYVTRTTSYWGSDFVIFKGVKHLLNSTKALKIEDYLDKNFFKRDF